MSQIKTVKGLSGMCYYYTHKGKNSSLFVKNDKAEEYFKKYKNSNCWQLNMIASLTSKNVGDMEFQSVRSF